MTSSTRRRAGVLGASTGAAIRRPHHARGVRGETTDDPGSALRAGAGAVRIVFAAVHKATGDPVATFRTDSVTQGLHPAKRPPAQRPAQCRSSPRSRQLRVEGPDRSSGTSNSKRAASGVRPMTRRSGPRSNRRFTLSIWSRGRDTNSQPTFANCLAHRPR